MGVIKVSPLVLSSFAPAGLGQIADDSGRSRRTENLNFFFFFLQFCFLLD